MMPFRILFVALCLTAFAATLFTAVAFAPAAQNPFISSKKDKTPPPKNPMAGYPAFLQPLMEKVAVLQHTLKRA